MTGYDIAALMEEIAPKVLACEWDSVGVMAGSLSAEITGIMLCLDLTQEVLEEAISEGCNMIITHHPLLFRPVKTLSEERPSGKLLSDIVRANILVFSAHTNLDFTDGGVNDCLIKQLGVVNVASDESGCHRFGDLPGLMSIRNFVQTADERLCAEGVRVILPRGIDADDYVRRIGVSCGSFDGETDWIYENHVDVLVTGEVKHSEAVALDMEGFATVAAGHYATEIWGVDGLAMLIGEHLMSVCGDAAPEVFVSSASRNPLRTV